LSYSIEFLSDNHNRDAFDNSAVAFYERFGFRQLKDNPRHLYVTKQEISKALNL
jgi:ribosomal protein S18 acetylase RimI-like enzyme